MFFRAIISALMVMTYGHCYGYDSLPSKDSGTVTISIQNAADKLSKIDSVFIIFDRYDLRGAGVIKQVFYPDFDNRIKISLPKGKYYVIIYCLGKYNKVAFDRIVSAKRTKINKAFLRLHQAALFQLVLSH